MFGRAPMGSLLPMLVLVCASLTMASPAFAQTSAGNKAAAEALFNEGRTLMQQENYPEACKKLEASQALDAGLGTMMLLSDCYEKVGKTASAWATFKDAAAAARAASDQDRETVARARADALEPKLAKALVQASKKTLSLGGLEVKMNGLMVPIAQLGTPVPVDPGKLTVTATAAGYKPWELTVDVVDGPSETTVDIPDLQPEEMEPPPPKPEPPPTTTNANAGTTATPEDQAVTEPGPDLSTVGIVVAGVGVVGLGVGSYFGLRAASKNDQSKKECEEKNLCSQKGVDLRDDAQSAATLSTISFGVGAALVATGVVLYLVSPTESSSESVSLSAGLEVGGASLGVGGTW